MKIKCDYCDGFMEDTDEICPHCGAVNANVKRESNGIPKTIDELKIWYQKHNLPPETVTRFFIGKDVKEPKAFGVYKDGERFIVYKNKADGSRAIRYDGEDEAYAVNELYLKLKERISEQKARNASGQSSARGYARPVQKKKKSKSSLLIFLVVCVVIIVSVIAIGNSPSQGYYDYNGTQYYYLDSWYSYSDSTGWTSTTAPDELTSDYDSYYEDYAYDSSYDTTDFEDTDAYQTWEEEQDNDSSDWDSDSSWSSDDSWSSDSGDWDSDW